MDRLLLNGYIERLIDTKGHDAEAREAVAEFARSMKGSSPFQVRGVMQKPGGSFTGQTPEHGPVQVDDEKPETKEFSRGLVQERAGYYKLWRQDQWIHISHFWKAEMETQSEAEMAQQWVLALNKDGQAQWFGERGLKHLYTLRLTRLFAIEFSREMFEEQWGTSIDRQHKGTLVVAVSVTA
jgi:hypothetical protein